MRNQQAPQRFVSPFTFSFSFSFISFFFFFFVVVVSSFFLPLFLSFFHPPFLPFLLASSLFLLLLLTSYIFRRRLLVILLASLPVYSSLLGNKRPLHCFQIVMIWHSTNNWLVCFYFGGQTKQKKEKKKNLFARTCVFLSKEIRCLLVIFENNCRLSAHNDFVVENNRMILKPWGIYRVWWVLFGE